MIGKVKLKLNPKFSDDKHFSSSVIAMSIMFQYIRIYNKHMTHLMLQS